MSASVDVHIVQQFTDGITQLAQQKMSRVIGAVDVDPGVVGDRAYYNQLGLTTMSKRTSRHGDTEYTDTPHLRRMLTLESYDNADLLDRDDKVQMLTDPTNSYTQSFAMAAGRTIDDVIIEAAFATASTGQTGTGTESWPGSGQEVDAGAGNNLDVDDVINAKEILDANEEPDEDRYFVLASSQLSSLLKQEKATSADYATVKALVKGEIDTFMGFTFIRSERLPSTGDVIRECIAFQKNSIKLGIGISPTGKVDILPTKKYSTQIYYDMRVGATRMNATGVVKVLCDEVP